MDGGVDVAVGLCELESASGHDALGQGKEGIEFHIFEAGGATALHERCDEVAGESGSMNVDPHAQYGGGINHAVNAGFAVVAHNQPAELQSGAHEALGAIVPKFDFAIVVLEV